jgi:D-mannonate dehydratase
MIWVAGRSPTLVSHSLRGVATNLKATTLAYLAIAAAYRRAIEVLAQFSLFICCCNYMPTARLRL